MFNRTKISKRTLADGMHHFADSSSKPHLKSVPKLLIPSVLPKQYLAQILPLTSDLKLFSFISLKMIFLATPSQEADVEAVFLLIEIIN
jgi:hypothetical protein